MSLVTDTNSQTARFSAKRQAIIDAAAHAINSDGVRGMTFVTVAERLGMTTTSITYYFRRREMLIEAAMTDALDLLAETVEQAEREGDERSRIARLVELNIELWRAIRADERQAPARLAEVRALDPEVMARLNRRYVQILRTLRSFFDAAGAKDDAVARAHLLAENMHWLAAWIANYTRADFERVATQLARLLGDGFLPDDRPLAVLDEPDAADEGEGGGETGVEAFLSVATRLINRRGYHGASIDRIAAELNVTKGSFYHHLAGKDALLLACFERSYARQSAAQHRAIAAGGTGAERLVRAIGALVADQFGERHELLRTTALEMLPADQRAQMISRSHRIARRFSGMLVDAMADGSIPVCDPMIGAQLLMVGINSAVELRRPGVAPDRAAYVRILTRGLLTR